MTRPVANAAAAGRFAGVLSTAASADPSAAPRPDFSAMTPAQFQAEVKAMYDRGEISSDTLWSGVTLRIHTQDETSFGYVGDGKFDYTAVFTNAREFAMRHGSMTERRNYDSILSAMGG